jgi:serine/threonine-protein kinase
LVLASGERSFEEYDALPRDSSASFPTPSAFGRYRVVHQVGVGVLGPVFRGYDPEQDRVVAIKALYLDVTPEQASDLAADLGRLPSIKIRHPFIIFPYGAGAEGSTAYLVEEYFVAESTDVALKQYGPPPVPDALRLIGQLAGALDAAAAGGVYHGALHLRDVLVAPHEMRLTGLGVVPAIERVGFRPQPRRPYAAPERMTGQPVTGASDVFSLACLAFELLTGHRPAPAGDGVSADTSGIEAADASALSEVFARVLSARPEDRHPSALAFAAALKHALTGAPLQTGAEIEPPKSRRPARARKMAVLPFDEEPPTPPAEQAPAPTVVAEPAAAVEPETEVVAVEDPVEKVTAPVEIPLDEPATVPASEPVRLDEIEFASRETLFEAEADPILTLSGPPMSEADEPEVRMFSNYSPESRAEPVVASPWRGRAPLLGALAIGLVVGFSLGYLVAPRGAPAAAARLRPSGSGEAGLSPASQPPAQESPAPPSSLAPASQPPVQAVAEPAPAEKAPAPAKAVQGTLVVASKPAGARVVLDGREAGKTPLTLRDVKPGSHKVRLELTGYRSWSSTVRVAAGRQRKIAASLERRPGG